MTLVVQYFFFGMQCSTHNNATTTVLWPFVRGVRGWAGM